MGQKWLMSFCLLAAIVLLPEAAAAVSLPAFAVAKTCFARGNTEFQRVSTDSSVLHFRRKGGSAWTEWRAPSAGAPYWSGMIGRPDQSTAMWFGMHSEIETAGYLRFVSSGFVDDQEGPVLVVRYFVDDKLLTISIRLTVCLNEGFALSVDADLPIIRSIELSAPNMSGQQQVLVPYFPYPVYRDQTSGTFTSYFIDWEFSGATRLGPLKPKDPDYRTAIAFYEPKTDGTRNRVHESFVVGQSDRLADVFPTPLVQRNPEASRLIGRPVVDAWFDWRFDQHVALLKKLKQRGLGNCIYILHIWQHEGPDNALPDHVPANAKQGGDAGLQAIVAAAHSVGCIFVLHQNYLDYYPNFPAFSEADIARNSNNDLLYAFLKRKPLIQTFAANTQRLRKESPALVRTIHELYRDDGVFHDVSGYFTPWRFADMDAGVDGAGTFIAYFNAHRDMLGDFRRATAGPVLSEGQNQFYWLGSVDAVEAQFGAGFRGRGLDAPLIPHFALDVVHPIQVNHGMGYYDRWANVPFRSDFFKDESAVDLYRMQEIIFGHQPYLMLSRNGDTTDERAMRQAEKEWFLVAPLARRYGGDKIELIEYLTSDGWKPIEDALKASEKLNVIRLRWKSGLLVTANGSHQKIKIDGMDLPPSGWIADGDDLHAYSALQNGHRVDFAKFKGMVYFDARGQEADFGTIVTACSGRLDTSTDAPELLPGADCAGQSIIITRPGAASPIRLPPAVDLVTSLSLRHGDMKTETFQIKPSFSKDASLEK